MWSVPRHLSLLHVSAIAHDIAQSLQLLYDECETDFINHVTVTRYN